MATYDVRKANAVRIDFALGKYDEKGFDPVSYRRIEVIIPTHFSIEDLADHLRVLLDNTLYQTHKEAHPHEV